VFAWVTFLIVAVGGLIGVMVATNILFPGLNATAATVGGSSAQGVGLAAATAPTYKVEAVVKLDVEFTDIKDMTAFEEGAQSSIATALAVSVSRVLITSVTPGSVVIGFEITSANKEVAAALSVVVSARVKAKTAVYVKIQEKA
jgi:hypothetical protein